MGKALSTLYVLLLGSRANGLKTLPPSSSTALNQKRTYNTTYDNYFSQHSSLLPPRIKHAVLTLPTDGSSPHLSPRQHLVNNNISINDEKILIIGDIHGCYKELRSVISKAKSINSFSAIISVGDLCNKGPQSLEVIRYIRSQTNFFSVRGNHDEGALCAALGDEKRRKKAKYSWVGEMSDDDIAWLAELPYTITIPFQDAKVVVVHAGLIPGVDLEEQEPETMITLRELGRSMEADDKKGSWVDAGKYPVSGEIRAWASIWNDKTTTVIFGHDARRGIQRYLPGDLSIGLDSGACYGKELTSIIMPDKVFVSVPAEEIYCPVSSNDD